MHFDLSSIMQSISLGLLVAAVVSYVRERRRQHEEFTELLWKILEVMSKLSGDEEVLRGFRTRSGRYIRPRSDRFEPRGTA